MVERFFTVSLEFCLYPNPVCICEGRNRSFAPQILMGVNLDNKTCSKQCTPYDVEYHGLFDELLVLAFIRVFCEKKVSDPGRKGGCPAQHDKATGPVLPVKSQQILPDVVLCCLHVLSQDPDVVFQNGDGFFQRIGFACRFLCQCYAVYGQKGKEQQNDFFHGFVLLSDGLIFVSQTQLS